MAQCTPSGASLVRPLSPGTLGISQRQGCDPAWALPACAHAESLLPCPGLCDPVDCVAHQAPLSIEFPREEYWSGLPFPPPGGLPNPGIKFTSPASFQPGRSLNPSTWSLDLSRGLLPVLGSLGGLLPFEWSYPSIKEVEGSPVLLPGLGPREDRGVARGRGRPPSAQSGHGVPTAPFVLGVAVATGRLLFFISRNFKNHPEKVTLL